MTDKQTPPDNNKGKFTPDRILIYIGLIIAILALLAELGSWLLPNPFGL